MNRVSFLFAFMLPAMLFGQNKNLRFEHIGTADGLSQSNVISLHEDSRGFMWFGTRDGLNKYDGYKIIVYKNDIVDPYSISNNTINDITEDKDGNLWIATANGLNKFDRYKQTFTRFLHDGTRENTVCGNNLNSVFIDKDNFIWIGSEGGGFDKYDPVHNIFKHFKNQPGKNSLSNNVVKQVFRDSDGTIFLATDGGGLCIFDEAANSFEIYQHNDKDQTTLSHNRIWEIFEDSKHRIWVGSMGGGLHLFDKKNKRFKRFNSCANGNCYPAFVLAIREDYKHNLWFGTENAGLWILNADTQEATVIREDFTSSGGLNNNSIWSILQDKKGNMWLGTFSGGVNLFNRDTDKFIHYQHTASPKSLSHNNVLTIYEDRKNNLWIGTDGGGLNKFDRTNGQFTHFKHEPGNPKSICENYVLTVTQSRDDNYWVGTWGGGVTMFNPSKNTYQHYKNNPADSTSLASNNVWVIFQDSDNYIWLGTYPSGLDRFDPKTKTFQHFRPGGDPASISYDMINAIFEDNQQNLWVGTNGGGLLRFDKKANRFVFYPNASAEDGLSNNVVNCIQQDSKGRLWIGTSYGLNYFHPRTGKFKKYFTKDGLPNESVFGILEDSQGNLWLSTNKGISKFNPEAETFKNYTVADGLQGDEFKQAYCKSRNGAFYFGGINGFNEFYPEKIREISYNPPLILTDIQVFNKPLTIRKSSQDSDPLERDISETKEITLTYKQSVISFEFASLNYTSTHKKQYAYMLENFDKDWNNVGMNRTATYTNLNPGHYTFRVKGLDNEGRWSDNAIALDVIITPPFWQTTWFELGSVIFAMGFVFLAYRLRVDSINRKKDELERLVKERTERLAISMQQERTAREEAEKARQEAEQATKAKSIFLATMSHEIRTPMNGVIGMASLLQETPLTDEQQDYVNTIRASGETLLTVINDILDFSKIESGRMELERKDFDLRICIEQVFDLFASKASDLHLDLIYQIDPNVPAQIVGDETRLKQILINLVGNAVKFTHQGEVFVNVHLNEIKNNEARLLFEIRDTGIGISKDKLDRLFKAFSQVDSSTTRKYGGTGLGLAICEKLIHLMNGQISVESQQGVGTVFRFTINAQISKKAIKTYVLNRTTGIENKSVLLVDDSATNLLILKGQLEKLKLATTTALSGSEALRFMEKSVFDLVITDMKMAEMSGEQFATTVKEKYPSTPVILLTSVGDEKKHVNSGLFASVLTKPVKQNVLYTQILNQLRQNTPQQPPPKDSLITDDYSSQFPMQIMIVDDNMINQKLTGRVLTKMGYQPDMADNGHHALELFATKNYDLIFMDVQMPELDGMETTRIIRSSNRRQPTIIAMTANAMEKDREECIQSGMNDYLSKPIKLDDMIATIKRWAREIARTSETQV